MCIFQLSLVLVGVERWSSALDAVCLTRAWSDKVRKTPRVVSKQYTTKYHAHSDTEDGVLCAMRIAIVRPET